MESFDFSDYQMCAVKYTGEGCPSCGAGPGSILSQNFSYLNFRLRPHRYAFRCSVCNSFFHEITPELFLKYGLGAILGVG